MKVLEPDRYEIRPNKFFGKSPAHLSVPYEAQVYCGADSCVSRFSTLRAAKKWCMAYRFKSFTVDEVTSNGRYHCD